ncbi:MAG: M15 family metallopeptidase [Micrococcales bacterium]|nr:M15 family metallopeptidase [Micrococcales bacterium]
MFGRTGVLVALAASTVVVPVAQGALASGSVAGGFGPEGLPSTVSVLTALSVDGQMPASLQASGALVDRDLETASRNLSRAERLPGCDGRPPSRSAANGQVPTSDLCTLWDGRTQVRADFAVALAELNQEYSARFGADLCLTSGYRTLAEQRAVRALRGHMAATPGKSNHGLGLAVDFCTDQLTTARYNWLRANGPRFGVDNPPWARPGGSKPERWHWEFTAAVAKDNSYSGSTADQGT